jgi:tripeptidyl-peptidase II
MLKNKYEESSLLKYKVSIKGKRGIYLRESKEIENKNEFMVEVEPIFTKKSELIEKVKFEKRFSLKASEEWIKSPKYLLLGTSDRQFKVITDSSDFEENTINSGTVDAYEDEKEIPSFRIPITIIKPIVLKDTKFEMNNLQFESGKINRYFINVPNGSTFCKIDVKINNFDTSRILVLHTLQVIQDNSYTKNEFEKYIRFDSEKMESFFIPVISEKTIEVLFYFLYNINI